MRNGDYAIPRLDCAIVQPRFSPVMWLLVRSIPILSEFVAACENCSLWSLNGFSLAFYQIYTPRYKNIGPSLLKTPAFSGRLGVKDSALHSLAHRFKSRCRQLYCRSTVVYHSCKTSTYIGFLLCELHIVGPTCARQDDVLAYSSSNIKAWHAVLQGLRCITCFYLIQ